MLELKTASLMGRVMIPLIQNECCYSLLCVPAENGSRVLRISLRRSTLAAESVESLPSKNKRPEAALACFSKQQDYRLPPSTTDTFTKLIRFKPSNLSWRNLVSHYVNTSTPQHQLHQERISATRARRCGSSTARPGVCRSRVFQQRYKSAAKIFVKSLQPHNSRVPRETKSVLCT